jgi:hypothetical protein
MRAKFLNIFGIVLTLVLWGLQMIHVLPGGRLTDFIKNHVFVIACFTGGAVLVYHFYDLIYSKHAIRRKWLRKFFAHIIATELGGDNYYTKISLMRPKYGYQIILPYLFYCILLNWYDNTANRKWLLRLKNIPIHLRTQYLTVYARYSYPQIKKSHTHFRITEIENHYNGIAEKAYRDGQVEKAKSLKISDVVMNSELNMIPGPDRGRIQRYMRDFHFSDYYYNTLQNINQPPNHIIAVPILRDVEVWGVMTVDINTDNYEGFNDELADTISNYAKIISQTIIFI